MKNQTAPSEPRIVIYSAIFGGYDAVFPIKRKDRNVDYVLISDSDLPRGSGWTAHPEPGEIGTFDTAEKNRWCKFFPHRMFPDHDLSIYIDGNIQLLNPVGELVTAFRTQGADIGLFRHPERTSLSEELDACLALGKLSVEAADLVSERMKDYETPDGPPRTPFTENGIIFRDHSAPHLDATMSLWWEEFHRVRRDQIALPWVLQQSRSKVAIWEWSYRNPNVWFLGPIIPHLGNLPPGLAGRIKLFLKHQKLRHRHSRAVREFDRQTAATDFFDGATP